MRDVSFIVVSNGTVNKFKNYNLISNYFFYTVISTVIINNYFNGTNIVNITL